MADLTPENYWPLGSTVQETTFNDNLLTDKYRHFGLISANPLNGHLVIIYRRGTMHVGDCGDIVIRHSSDGGTNWDEEEFVYSESGQGYDVRTAGGGYDSNGRLFIFFSTYDPSPPPDTDYWVAMKYIYSNNDGAIWLPSSTNPPYIVPVTLNKDVSGSGEINTRFNPYGHIVDVGNNILYQTWFGGVPVTGAPSLYRIYLYKSTDGGLSFPTIITVNPYPAPRQPWGEASMVNVGGGCFLLLARKNENPPTYLSCEYNHFIQFKSEDNCETWSEQGTTTFEDPPPSPPPTRYAAPPWLSFINYEGVGIVACYYTNRYLQLLKVIFCLAKDLLEGPDDWNNSPIKEVHNYNGTVMSGYQSFFLPLNQYQGIGVCFKENGSNCAYPIIVFTKIEGMTDVLIALGL